MATIQDYCERVGVLVDGQIIMFSSVENAIETYQRLNR